MPPVAALGLCITLVVFLVSLTTRGTEGKSPGLWIPTLWMLIGASRPIGMWLNPEASSSPEGLISGSLSDQMVLGSLVLLALVIISRRRSMWSSLLKQNRWVLILILYMGLSILWSDYAVVSLKRWVKAAGTVLCAMVIMTEPDPLRAVELLLRRIAYVLVPFSIVLVKYFPVFGVEYGRWGGVRMAKGVCMQKNGLGLLCTVSAIFLIWDLMRKGRLSLLRSNKRNTIADILILLMTFYLLKGADTGVYSASSIGVLIVGLFAMFFLDKLRAHPEHFRSFLPLTAIIAAIFIGAAIFLKWSPVGWSAKLLGRDETLTGRVDIWAEIFKIAPRWSLFGKGFGGFWGLPYTYIPIGQMTGHSGYLDVYVELGAFGVAILILFLLNFWHRLSTLAKHEFDWALLGSCFLLISLLYNYTESDYLNVASTLWLAIVHISFAVSAVEQGTTIPSVLNKGRQRDLAQENVFSMDKTT